MSTTSTMVCLIQNERERTSIETHLEHYLMIMVKRERERERWMAEVCDLVYHNNMHSFNTCDLVYHNHMHLSMRFVEYFEMQINCHFTRWVHQQ